MKNTVRNFWKMIFDRKCAVIVMLSDFKESGKACVCVNTHACEHRIEAVHGSMAFITIQYVE